MLEQRKRSILKAVSYRFSSTLITIFIVFAFTGRQLLSLGVGAVEVVSKLAYFYIHERAWNRIKWGKLIG